MKELVKTFEVLNDLGIHARAAAKIVALERQYVASLILKKEDQEVDGSSILSILTLACPKGARIEARISGEDAETFMEKLSELIERRFDEPR